MSLRYFELMSLRHVIVSYSPETLRADPQIIERDVRDVAALYGGTPGIERIVVLPSQAMGLVWLKISYRVPVELAERGE